MAVAAGDPECKPAIEIFEDALVLLGVLLSHIYIYIWGDRHVNHSCIGVAWCSMLPSKNLATLYLQMWFVLSTLLVDLIDLMNL